MGSENFCVNLKGHQEAREQTTYVHDNKGIPSGLGKAKRLLPSFMYRYHN
jgi:hypothetical protein